MSATFSHRGLKGTHGICGEGPRRWGLNTSASTCSERLSTGQRMYHDVRSTSVCCGQHTYYKYKIGILKYKTGQPLTCPMVASQQTEPQQLMSAMTCMLGCARACWHNLQVLSRVSKQSFKGVEKGQQIEPPGDAASHDLHDGVYRGLLALHAEVLSRVELSPKGMGNPSSPPNSAPLLDPPATLAPSGALNHSPRGLAC
eukprot:1158809-Pelagomonas_calceolata.AAC.2